MSKSSGNTSKCHEIPFKTLKYKFSPRGCAPHPAETAGASPRTPIPSPSCMRGLEGLSPPRVAGYSAQSGARGGVYGAQNAACGGMLKLVVYLVSLSVVCEL